MRVLVTGSRGFVGQNLVETLKNIRDGKDKRARYQELLPLTIYEYDKDSSDEDLAFACEHADFVFNLAGVNRPQNTEEFYEGNFGFASTLLSELERFGNTCPVMLASSIQANLDSPHADSDYARSKRAGEELFCSFGQKNKSEVLIYRFPNLFGKWCRPNYNSVVATFCYNVAHDIPLTISDGDIELDLLYIDDLIEQLLEGLCGRSTVDESGFVFCGNTHRVSLGSIADLLYEFKESRTTHMLPDMPAGSFAKKLFATYLTYLDSQDFIYSLVSHVDERGSFTEIIKTRFCGQMSVNISKPGITKGQHWHHTKWEKFCVVSGTALIEERRIGTDSSGREYEPVRFNVSGDTLQVVDMIPGYTHNIINTGNTDLVTLMWCNEIFDPENPDTFGLEV